MKELEGVAVDLTGVDSADVISAVRACCSVIGRRGMSRTLTQLVRITDNVDEYAQLAALSDKQLDSARKISGQCSTRSSKCYIYVCTRVGELTLTQFGVLDTLAHEVAHWIAGNQHGHNSRWRRIYAKCVMVMCRQFDISADLSKTFTDCVYRYCRPESTRNRDYAYSLSRFDRDHRDRYRREMVDAANQAFWDWTPHH